MWTSSETLIFTEKTYRSQNSPTCENAVARTHGSWMLRVMGSCFRFCLLVAFTPFNILFSFWQRKVTCNCIFMELNIGVIFIMLRNFNAVVDKVIVWQVDRLIWPAKNKRSRISETGMGISQHTTYKIIPTLILSKADTDYFYHEDGEGGDVNMAPKKQISKHFQIFQCFPNHVRAL